MVNSIDKVLSIVASLIGIIGGIALWLTALPEAEKPILPKQEETVPHVQRDPRQANERGYDQTHRNIVGCQIVFILANVLLIALCVPLVVARLDGYQWHLELDVYQRWSCLQGIVGLLGGVTLLGTFLFLICLGTLAFGGQDTFSRPYAMRSVVLFVLFWLALACFLRGMLRKISLL
jgi:hypothetical protein